MSKCMKCHAEIDHIGYCDMDCFGSRNLGKPSQLDRIEALVQSRHDNLCYLLECMEVNAREDTSRIEQKLDRLLSAKPAIGGEYPHSGDICLVCLQFHGNMPCPNTLPTCA